MNKKIVISIAIVLIIGLALYKNLTPTPLSPQENIQEELTPTLENTDIQISSAEVKQDNKILVKKDYEKGLKIIEANKLKKEEQRKIKLQAAIKEIESQGFEVDQENETISPLLYIEDSKKEAEKYALYSYKQLKFRYVEELNKYTKTPFYLKFENPLGEDFIINYGDLLKKSRISSGEIMISSFLNKEQVLNNIQFESVHLKYYDSSEGGGLGFDVRLKGNTHIENFHFNYQRSTPKNPDTMRLIIDVDKLTGKKAERIESTNHWGEH